MVVAVIFYVLVGVFILTFIFRPRNPRDDRISEKKAAVNKAWNQRFTDAGWDKSKETCDEYHARTKKMLEEHQAELKAVDVNEPKLETDVTSTPALNQKQAGWTGAIIGLLVVIGLAWAGGKFGSGNSWFPSENKPIRPVVDYSNRPPPQPGLIWVDPYYKRDGTYVQGHWRTEADGDPRNNLNPREPNYSKPRR